MEMHLTWPLLFLIVSVYGAVAVPLLLSETRSIKLFENSDSTNKTTLVPNAQHAIALDYHLARDELYFSNGLGRIYRGRLTPNGEVGPYVIVEVKICDGLAVDWIHDNLYWTDVRRQTVEVATLDGLYRRVLFNVSHGLDKPRAIVVDPDKGILFWTDWGNDARVESSGLDGKQKKTVVSSDLYWPNGLALDLQNSIIYILDGYVSTISSCNYDGSNLKVLKRSQDNIQHAFGLTFYANRVYWGSWRARSLFSMNTITRSSETIIRQTGLMSIIDRMMGLKAVHFSLQQKKPSLRDPCSTAGCSHRCLLGRHLTTTCICPFGFELSTDGKTCVEEGYLLVSWRRTIRRYNLDATTEEPLIDDAKAAISIAYHLKKELVFWSDIEEHRIYRAPLGQLNNKTVIASPETCNGLAIDWVHDVLYWTDTDGNTLEAAQLDGSKHMVIFSKNMDEPRDIAVDPFSGLIFWTDWGGHPKIERATLDGLERKVIVGSDNVWPNGITLDIDSKKIYWVDGKIVTITSNSYDGSDQKAIFKPSILINHHLFSITVFKNQLYWTDWKSRGLFRSPNNKITQAYRLANSSIILLRPNGVRVVHSSLQRPMDNPCAVVRCQNLCLGTTSHQAHCMGEGKLDVGNGTESEKPELIKTVFNDSIHILLTKAKTPTIVSITTKCISREACRDDIRCGSKSVKPYAFQNQDSFNITGLLPASTYEVTFMSLEYSETFQITTSNTHPPEMPNIKSIENEDKTVIIKWDPVDTCVPGFKSYHYKRFKTAVDNDASQEGSTNLTEVNFDSLEPGVSYTVHIYTYDPKYFSPITFNIHSDEPKECQSEELICDGKEDCSDGSDEDVRFCAGIENVIVYKKTKSEVFFRVDVTNGTIKNLEKFVGKFSSAEPNSAQQFESEAVPCAAWPESYCLQVSSLKRNTAYNFSISAALRQGIVGKKFAVSAITKEEVSGPPEDIRSLKYNATSLLINWHHPNQSNGIIRSFITNIDETERFEEDKCCQSFPIIESAVSSEESLYEIAITDLTPASTYAISIAAKNMYVGRPATVVVSTPPPPIALLKNPKVQVTTFLPLSWQPMDKHDDLPQYHPLIRSYMLVLLPPRTEALTNAENNNLGPLEELLKSKFGDRILVLWHKAVEETEAFQSPIHVDNLTARKQYQLAWVQVAQYKDAYSVDYILSDPFMAI